MSKARTIAGGRCSLGQLVVLKDFEGRSLLASPGQPQVNPLKPGTRNASGKLEPRSFQVPGRRYLGAAKDLLVETSQSSPILGDEIRMDKSDIWYQAPTSSLRSSRPLSCEPPFCRFFKRSVSAEGAGNRRAILLQMTALSK